MKGMRNIAPFGLRMPEELREAITERATKNGRSINAEIIKILSDALDREAISEVMNENEDDDNLPDNPSELEVIQNEIIDIQNTLVTNLKKQMALVKKIAREKGSLDDE